MRLKDIFRPEESATQNTEASQRQRAALARTILINNNPNIRGSIWQNAFADHFATLYLKRVPLFGRIQQSKLNRVWADAYLATFEEAAAENPKLQEVLETLQGETQAQPTPQAVELSPA